jgi:RecB family exonuclease
MEIASQLYRDLVRPPFPAPVFHTGLRPATGQLMMSPVHVGDVADAFLADEAERRKRAIPAGTEVEGRLTLTDLDFTLTGTADRIDRDTTGMLYIYDYKTGSIPSEKQQKAYDKQLLFEAVMAEAGALKGLAPASVSEVAYIGLGAIPKFARIAVGPELIEDARAGLHELIRAYQNRDQGYTARRIVANQAFEGDYDHLSRYGEWDHTMQAVAEREGE